MQGKARVAVGLSGGVDSGVTAALLLRQGYEVVGVNIIMTEQTGGRDDAGAIAEHLGIKLYTIDAREEFVINVIHKFIHSFNAGITPNPCIICNPCVKFPKLLTAAEVNNCELIATGHYADIRSDIICQSIMQADTTQNDVIYNIHAPKDMRKDQSYFLCKLDQDILRRTLTPLSAYTKAEVRALAEQWGLPVAKKRDSQEVCFISGGQSAGDFVAANCDGTAGDFVDASGKVLGQHKGICHYTIGQRKGLGIAFGEPRFVTAINPRDNTVVIGEERELYTNIIHISDISMVHPSYFNITDALAKIRYAAPKAKCAIEYTSPTTATLTFDEPQRAATPGQTVALYAGDVVIGGGEICAIHNYNKICEL